MPDLWVVKRRHYDGGTSVVSAPLSYVEAAREADDCNYVEQSGRYYIEEWRGEGDKE